MKFSEISQFFKKGDCLVVNETKVFPARLFGRKEKTNAKIEVFLLRELNKEENIWDVIVDPARKVRIGNKIFFDEGRLWCEVIDNTTSRGRTVRFNVHGRFLQDHRPDREDAAAVLHQAGADREGQGDLPDRLCPGRRGRCRAHGRTAFHEASADAP